MSRIIILLLFLLPYITFSQTAIDFIDNPSFESEPKQGRYYTNATESKFITSWFDCGIVEFPDETKPDIHSVDTRYWSVNHAPSEGNTFLGLIVRDDGSWKSVTQDFIAPIKEGYCYKFTIDLSKAAKYVSRSRLFDKKNEDYNYESSVSLNIWAGKYLCDKSQLIYKSPPIDHERWKSYEVNFKSTSNIDCLTIQAYFTDESKPYNGHVLVDNISKFSITDCVD